MNAPILEVHRGITVVRDDLFPAGPRRASSAKYSTA